MEAGAVLMLTDCSCESEEDEDWVEIKHARTGAAKKRKRKEESDEEEEEIVCCKKCGK